MRSCCDAYAVRCGGSVRFVIEGGQDRGVVKYLLLGSLGRFTTRIYLPISLLLLQADQIQVHVNPSPTLGVRPLKMLLHELAAALQERLTTHPIETLLASLPVVLLTYVVVNEVVRYQARVPGMKGPPGLPLVGNLLSIRKNAAAKYKEWSKTYGDVYQVQMGNVPVVVVNSAKAAKALWVGQSQALSSRPITYTFHKVRSTCPMAFPQPYRSGDHNKGGSDKTVRR